MYRERWDFPVTLTLNQQAHHARPTTVVVYLYMYNTHIEVGIGHVLSKKCKHVHVHIYIYMYIYSLVPGPRTAQTRIRLVKLVNSVTKFCRGIDKFH